MHLLNKVSLALATAGLLSSGAAQAELIDRGGGLLYDDVLNVTWLQDANYAKTSGYTSGGSGYWESGYTADGLMMWGVAVDWARGLNISRFAGESLTGWRLATNTPVGADWNYDSAYDGSTDIGYNITSPHSELSYMYYVNLGLKGEYSPSGAIRTDYGIFRDGTGGEWGQWGQANIGLVKNLQSKGYWSGTQVDQYAMTVWSLSTSFGRQGVGRPHTDANYAWAVRAGDVAAVPEPETYAMLLAGLGLLGVGAKRRSR